MFGGRKALRVFDRFGIDALNTRQRVARQVLAYGTFSAGMKRFADIASDAGSDVYMYKFKYISPENEKLGLGAAHTSELPFAFNNIDLKGLSGPDAEALAEETHRRWINFIKTGDPNAGESVPSGVTWPKYDSAETNILYLDKKITSGVLEDRENIDFIANLAIGDRR
jgi:para-nitrobenzyl esterase